MDYIKKEGLVWWGGPGQRKKKKMKNCAIWGTKGTL